MIKKCNGCGINLQSTNKDKEGYVDDLNKNICERCFKLKNYGEYKITSLTNNDYYQILELSNIIYGNNSLEIINRGIKLT